MKTCSICKIEIGCNSRRLLCVVHYKQQWKQQNLTRENENNRRYYQENTEKVKDAVYDRYLKVRNTQKYKTYRKCKEALHRAILLQATPKWSNLVKIAEIYENCPEGFHVDHIIPLKGKTVCGLHVPENLQYLPAGENLKKSNKLL